jgi:hypothetical protein
MIKYTVVANSPAVLLGVCKGPDGNLLHVADVSSISVKTFDLDDDSNAITTTATPAVSDCIHDTLLVDARAYDSVGYNISIPMSGASWPEAGTYQVEAKITPVAGEPIYGLWSIEALKIFSQ